MKKPLSPNQADKKNKSANKSQRAKIARTTLSLPKDQLKELKIWAARKEMKWKDAVEHIFDNFLKTIARSKSDSENSES